MPPFAFAALGPLAKSLTVQLTVSFLFETVDTYSGRKCMEIPIAIVLQPQNG